MSQRSMVIMKSAVIATVFNGWGISLNGALYPRHRLRYETPEELLELSSISCKLIADDKQDAQIMQTLTYLKAYAFCENGERYIWMYSWSRDCDQCEGDGITKIPATVEAIKAFENDLFDNAEGPCHCHLISPEQAADFESSFRDRRAEQYNY